MNIDSYIELSKPKWHCYEVHLRTPQTNESEIVKGIYALNQDHAGFLAFRKTKLRSCYVEKVVEVMSNAS